MDLHIDTAEWVSHKRTYHTTVALPSGGSEPAVSTQKLYILTKDMCILYRHTVADHTRH